MCDEANLSKSINFVYIPRRIAGHAPFGRGPGLPDQIHKEAFPCQRHPPDGGRDGAAA